MFVAPLRFGSGIKVKVINALYRGLPVSTTSVGVEGLLIENGCQAFVADDGAEMAQGIGVLLTDADRWRTMRDASRELARKEYTWQASLMRIEEAARG